VASFGAHPVASAIRELRMSPRPILEAAMRCVYGTIPLPQLAVKKQETITVEVSGNVVTLRYPSEAQGETFATSYADVRLQLAAWSEPFRLVHDLRRTNLFDLKLDDVIADAAMIGQAGMVERVAFVVDVNPILHATITLGLVLSPVQPAQIFASDVEAQAWAAIKDERALPPPPKPSAKLSPPSSKSYYPYMVEQ